MLVRGLSASTWRVQGSNLRSLRDSYRSPGSVFNEPGGVNSANGGTGGNAYNSAGPDHLGAPSQYDVACYQQSVY